MSHLGSLVSALADGQLRPEEAERALAHVAVCTECADELAAARAARAALASAGDLAPDADLTARLLALADSPPAEPPSVRSPRPPRPGPGTGSLPIPGTGSRAGTLSGGVAQRRSRVPMVAAVLSGVLLFALFALGNEPDITFAPRPADALSTLHDAAVAADGGRDGLAALDSWFAAHPWAVQARVPDGYRLAAARTTSHRVELDLEGPDGMVVVTQTRGRLTGGGVAVEVGGHRVLQMGDGPALLAWQSGDAVVSVVAEGPPWAATPVVAAYPVESYDGGAPARVTRGWQILTAWSGS
ncbi:zf-HC2 domain-containing protein [Isoptericola sp. b490]|uniref:zf-HC2 domain-containing protein n=1 Tax=Actinotalea lenta TaxID=3064654 RepID=UPI002712D415|nr:zf-HC2 domain-containing protein [Isoptericola sp. b490]MDO8121396.1 zf-HC2 domain-containing protein [Isoptericola sp. b490]